MVARIENQVDILGHGQVVLLDNLFGKVPLQDGQFLVVASVVAGAQQTFVFGGNLQDTDFGRGEIVLDKQVFAKGRIAVL